MIRSQMFVLTVTVIGLANWMPGDVAAQQIYSRGTPADLQYSRSRGIDSNGRAVDVDGRVIDQIGSTVDDYGRRITNVGVPRQYQVNGYASGSYGGYYPGVYNGVSYTDSVGVSGGYYSNTRPVGSAVVVGANPISPPQNVIVGGVYPSRTKRGLQQKKQATKRSSCGKFLKLACLTSFCFQRTRRKCQTLLKNSTGYENKCTHFGEKNKTLTRQLDIICILAQVASQQTPCLQLTSVGSTKGSMN